MNLHETIMNFDEIIKADTARKIRESSYDALVSTDKSQVIISANKFPFSFMTIMTKEAARELAEKLLEAADECVEVFDTNQMPLGFEQREAA